MQHRNVTCSKQCNRLSLLCFINKSNTETKTSNRIKAFSHLTRHSIRLSFSAQVSSHCHTLMLSLKNVILCSIKEKTKTSSSILYYHLFAFFIMRKMSFELRLFLWVIQIYKANNIKIVYSTSLPWVSSLYTQPTIPRISHIVPPESKCWASQEISRNHNETHSCDALFT